MARAYVLFNMLPKNGGYITLCCDEDICRNVAMHSYEPNELYQDNPGFVLGSHLTTLAEYNVDTNGMLFCCDPCAILILSSSTFDLDSYTISFDRTTESFVFHGAFFQYDCMSYCSCFHAFQGLADWPNLSRFACERNHRLHFLIFCHLYSCLYNCSKSYTLVSFHTCQEDCLADMFEANIYDLGRLVMLEFFCGCWIVGLLCIWSICKALF